MKSKIEMIHVFINDSKETVYRVFYNSGSVREYKTEFVFGMPDTVYKFIQGNYNRTIADTRNGKTVIYYERKS